MAAPDYSSKAIVLKKTKLAEADLILTFLDESGRQIRAVAKGARKPKSAFSASCELYNCVNLLLAKGKSLDIVKEAKITQAPKAVHADIIKSACASCVAELCALITEPELEHARLFDLAFAALNSIDSAENDSASITCVIAFCVKAFAFAGFTPQLSKCSICGVDGQIYGASNPVEFSYSEGGFVCSDCATSFETIKLDVALIQWLNTLLFSKFIDLPNYSFSTGLLSNMLMFCQQWSAYHIGRQLKSITFLQTCQQNAQ